MIYKLSVFADIGYNSLACSRLFLKKLGLNSTQKWNFQAIQYSPIIRSFNILGIRAERIRHKERWLHVLQFVQSVSEMYSKLWKHFRNNYARGYF